MTGLMKTFCLYEFILISQEDKDVQQECYDDFDNILSGILFKVQKAINLESASSLDTTANELKDALNYLGAYRTAKYAHKLQMLGKKDQNIDKARITFQIIKKECEKFREFMVNT